MLSGTSDGSANGMVIISICIFIMIVHRIYACVRAYAWLSFMLGDCHQKSRSFKITIQKQQAIEAREKYKCKPNQTRKRLFLFAIHQTNLLANAQTKTTYIHHHVIKEFMPFVFSPKKGERFEEKVSVVYVFDLQLIEK
mmetsp:Transcript_2893/g.4482  ORF Transcript_2893/g.4482 Transcript_2893/m.4482 type:complete len:139 (-) Transcript_2893:109-525(-)